MLRYMFEENIYYISPTKEMFFFYNRNCFSYEKGKGRGVPKIPISLILLSCHTHISFLQFIIQKLKNELKTACLHKQLKC